MFTEKRFTGNPLAVVLNSAGLATEAMQAIAREFGHPETVFALPPDNPAHRARLRIFTPASELPFAGHPTVGTAVLLHRLDGGEQSEIVLEENIGDVACRVERADADRGRASFALPQLPVVAGAVPEPADVAAALSIDAADIGFDGYATTQRWSAGNAVTFVPLRGLAPVARAKPEPALFEPTFGREGRAVVYLYCGETAERGHDFHARMFAPKLGVAEDPATGSAAAAFAGVLAGGGRFADGAHIVHVEQGYEMGRPSQITLSFTLIGRKLIAASVGGGAVIVTEGVIEA